MLIKREVLERSVSFYVYRESEFGRSMVEMLGVLAIIGVLSITAISGFNFAMGKVKANEVASQVSVAYIEIMSSSATRNQANTFLNLPDSSVSLVDASGYQKVGIKADFGNDVSACKQFVNMYQNSSIFHIKFDCTK